MQQNQIQQEKAEVILSRLIAQEKEIEEWFSPSLAHLESLATIFDGCEGLKENSCIVDQLFKIFLLIDKKKKDKFRTLRHWEIFHQFAQEIQSSLYFQKTYDLRTLKMMDSRISHMWIYMQRCIQATKLGHKLYEIRGCNCDMPIYKF